jgi:DNA repair protein RecO (recombination protein O)
MTSFVDLCVVLKSFPFQERDKIVVTFTENHGKVTGLAKGAIHSKRFGGSLDLLSCSNIHFVQKNPTAEFLFISEAVTHHEFQGFGKDFEKLSYASFAIEICYHLSETLTPQRELFVALCNFLFHLNQNMSPLLALNAFISKSCISGVLLI